MQNRIWSIGGLLIGLAGVFGLIRLITEFWPTPSTRILFILLLFITAGGLMLPAASYLNFRFADPDWQAQDRWRLAREAAWVGGYAAVIGLLLSMKALNITIALVLAGIFGLMEIFFLTRE
jgi:hypothetical protein